MIKLYTTFCLFILALNQLKAQNVNVTATLGAATATYPTLKNAFDAINTGIHNGAIVVTIASSTTETATALLNGAGIGAANYLSILVKPSATSIISGDIPGPLIELFGADKVTIDGRIGASPTTRSLTLRNLSTADAVSVSTVRFRNGAQFDTLNYLNLQGSAPLGTSGKEAVILFETSGATTLGNKDIVVSNNDISPASGNLPAVAIYSIGEPDKTNSAIKISGNLIHDYFSSSGLSSAILLDSFSTEWSITGNNFYQTPERATTGNSNHYIINVYGGSGYTITNNIVGGRGPSAPTSSYSIHGTAFNNYLVGIYLRLDTSGLTTNIDGNTISQFVIRSTPGIDARMFDGIRVESGNVNIGVNSGNTIGALIGDSYILTHIFGNNNNFSAGINTSSGNVDIQNNTIGAVFLVGFGGGTGTANFSGIECYGHSSLNIHNNSVGGTENNPGSTSIRNSTRSASFVAILVLESTSGTNHSITSNTIRNITNNGTFGEASVIGIKTQIVSDGVNIVTTISSNNINYIRSPSNVGGATGSVTGIMLTRDAIVTNSTADCNINNNQITNLLSNSTNADFVVEGIINYNPFTNFLNIDSNLMSGLSSKGTSTSQDGVVVGVRQANIAPSSSGICSVTGNAISNLENTATAATTVIGLSVSHDNIAAIQNNKINDLRNPNATAGGQVLGLNVRGISSSGTFNVYNNMIALSPANVETYGIYNSLTAAQINAYYNSVYLNGTASGTNNSAGFFRNNVATGVSLINNILYNVRSGSGGHYSISNTNATPSTGWLSDNNNLYTTDPDTVALWGANNNDLATYKTSANDANSKSFVLSFVSPIIGDLHLAPSSYGNPNLKGITIASILTDFDGQLRNNTPYIGADEVLLAPLPIELEFFTGRRQSTVNLLSWKTSCTSASIAFEIERSVDGIRFITIGRVTASQGRCAQPFDYTDALPGATMNYYRLKMIQPDGAMKYSGIIAILSGSVGFEFIGLYPNLIQSSTTASLTAASKTSIQIQVTDISGRLIQQKPITIAKGSSLINIDFSLLSKGVYYFTVDNGHGYIKTVRFVKQ